MLRCWQWYVTTTHLEYPKAFITTDVAYFLYIRNCFRWQFLSNTSSNKSDFYDESPTKYLISSKIKLLRVHTFLVYLTKRSLNGIFRIQFLKFSRHLKIEFRLYFDIYLGFKLMLWNWYHLKRISNVLSEFVLGIKIYRKHWNFVFSEFLALLSLFFVCQNWLNWPCITI